MSPQRRTVWIVQSAQSAWRSSRLGTQWQDWNVSAGFTRTAFRGGLPKTRAGVRYTSTLFHEQVRPRKLMSTGVGTHAWMLEDENRGERAGCACGKLSGVCGSGQSSLHALSRLWVIRSVAWCWGLAAFEFSFWDILTFERIRTLYPHCLVFFFFFFLSPSLQLNMKDSLNGMELDIRGLRWKSSMADYEPLILHCQAANGAEL